MAGYVALVHKGEGTSYGVASPTYRVASRPAIRWRRRLPNAADALAGHLALMKRDGDPIPKARSLQVITVDPAFADDLEGADVKHVEPLGSIMSTAE